MHEKEVRAEFKAHVAMEALAEGKTLSEIAGQHGVHPSQGVTWKKELASRANEICEKNVPGTTKAAEVNLPEIYRQPVCQLMGQLSGGATGKFK